MMSPKRVHLVWLVFCSLGLAWGIISTFGSSDLGDFGSFYESGRAALRGLNPYSVYPLTGSIDVPGISHLDNPNLDPPISVLLFAPFGLIAPAVGLILWKILSCLLYGLVVLALLRAYPERRRGPAIGLAIGFAPFWGTVGEGNIYVLLAALVVGAWLALRSQRSVTAGLLLGVLVAIKPPFLVWIGLLFLARYRKSAVVGAASAAALSALPLLVFGPAIYRAWLATILAPSGRLLAPTNLSLLGISAQLGSAVPGMLVAGLLLAGAGFWAWRRRPSRLDVSRVALVVMLLASPFSWFTYLIYLLPVFFERRWTLPLGVAALCLLVPAELAEHLWIWLPDRLIALGFPWILSLPLILYRARPVSISDHIQPKTITLRSGGKANAGRVPAPVEISRRHE